MDEDHLTHDKFLGGRLLVAQPQKGYRAATDPVMLAAACPARAGDQVLELGCGVGAALLCLWSRTQALLTGVELQEDYAQLARRNVAHNGCDAQIVTADLRTLPDSVRQRSFQHVIANPPYFDPAQSTKSDDAGRDVAFRHSDDDMRLWVDVGLKRLRQGGSMTLIHRIEALPLMIAATHGRGGDLRILPIVARQGRDAKRVIFQIRKGRRGPPKLLSPLIMHEGDQHTQDGDDYTLKVQEILRQGAAISL